MQRPYNRFAFFRYKLQQCAFASIFYYTLCDMSRAPFVFLFLLRFITDTGNRIKYM